ncbi:NADPH-dependent FMN reductase [Nocardia seriolae]|uniref:FMN reductase n=1 Tax=Nocardia seriolae TaxID=37332 RepID=A0A0B8N2G0_9NOCA|nr:NADPH-dependent FMN reductase [Nocardia seriolae]APA96549.1 Fumarate reductase (quinol) [Nocardia seriolae]MTJ61616.1 FMN reductase [Nocardia seriolae]MTJ71583.1 FMN reductase [Nocardia seriolae]MTJ86636.1 FMN reductase [Nocardia seriolae]MTK30631.1 FMN reductase [Nocardia seriolae]
MTDHKILAISGSLRADSHNTALLRAAQKFGAGLDIEIYDQLREIPPYDLDLDTPALRPAVVAELRDRITAADGLLIATPEFNYSIPGVLKNALDWVSTDWTKTEGLPLLRKPIAIMGAAPTQFGSVRAQLALRQVFVWTESDVVVKPEVIAFRSHERFDDDGNLVDETTVGLLTGLLSALATKIDRAAESR